VSDPDQVTTELSKMGRICCAKLTNGVYTNVDPALRQAIDLLPVAELF